MIQSPDESSVRFYHTGIYSTSHSMASPTGMVQMLNRIKCPAGRAGMYSRLAYFQSIDPSHQGTLYRQLPVNPLTPRYTANLRSLQRNGVVDRVHGEVVREIAQDE